MNAVLEAREPSARYIAELESPLLDQFDLIVQATNGVARLRELILTLAVQGKLVPQNLNDEPASALLERIRAEKARLIKAGSIRKDKPVAAIADEEKVFDLPSGWEWVRGADIYSVIRGVTYQKDEASNSPNEKSVPILRANNIRGTVNFEELVYVPKHLVSAEQNLLQGDFVVCLASGSKNLVGKVAIFQGNLECSFGAFCGAIRAISKLDYLGVFFASPLYRNAVSEASAGIGINNLKSTSLQGLTIPLPPLAEQSRIVVRVEELMALCDALEAKGKLEAEQHARLVSRLFESLANSDSAHVLAENWQRIATYFDLLLDRPSAVDALEQTILQLAVRGLLVPQNLADEPASELLQKIRAEKDRLIATGQLKRDKPLPPIGDEGKPFELPQGWEWTRLGSVTKSVDYGTSQKATEIPRGIPVLRMSNIQSGRVLLSGLKYFQDQEGELPNLFLLPGDLLFNRTNSFELVGKTGIFEGDANMFTFASYLIRIRADGAIANSSYINLYMNSLDCRKTQIEPQIVQQNGQANFNGTKLQNICLPLPPLSEQSRIVARVAELRTLCTQLRTRLATTAQTQSRLAATLIEKAVS